MQNPHASICATFALIATWLTIDCTWAQLPGDVLRQALSFHAPFDGSADAVVGSERNIYTAETLARKSVIAGLQVDGVVIAPGAGKYGDALRFTKTGRKVLFFKGANMPFAEQNWSGTVSFWLKLNPDKDLNPDYCDPLQITEKAWNDAAFFVDFDKGASRDFRLGAFSDYRHWNPSDVKWEALPVDQRPMVTVKRPPFASDRWTHIAFCFDNVNASGDVQAKSTLFLDGQSQGEIAHPQQIHWDLDRTAIMIGINYIGDFDELSIFNRKLTNDQIKQLATSEVSPLAPPK